MPTPESIKLNRKKLARWLRDPEIRAEFERFKVLNPRCCYCGRPTTTSHHDEKEDYRSKEAYKEGIRNGIPICKACHHMYANGFVICPDCKVHYMLPDKRHCKHCLTPEEMLEKRQNEESRKQWKRDSWVNYREFMKTVQQKREEAKINA